jgi:transposase InsO family protein
MVVAQPQKRPRSSFRRFQAAQVHQCWQLDAFEWPLTVVTGHPGSPRPAGQCVIYQVLDDRSRFVLATRVGPAGIKENAADAVAVVDQAISTAGRVPCLLLSDNGSAFNQSRRGITSQLVAHLTALGTRPITGRPYHPQTQGKDERVHQTLQRWLRAHPAHDQGELQSSMPSTPSTTTAAPTSP